MIRRKSKPGENAQRGKGKVLGQEPAQCKQGTVVSSWHLEMRS